MTKQCKIRRSVHILAGSTLFILLSFTACRDGRVSHQLVQDFQNPPDEAKPWVFWYWINAAVSREGITADLEAMKEAGNDVTVIIGARTKDLIICEEEIRKFIGFTTLRFLTLEEMVKAVIEAPNNKDLKNEDLCTYCWTGSF